MEASRLLPTILFRGQLSLVEERRRDPLTPIRLGAMAVYVFVHRSEFIVPLALLSLSHILSTTSTLKRREWNEEVRSIFASIPPPGS